MSLGWNVFSARPYICLWSRTWLDGWPQNNLLRSTILQLRQQRREYGLQWAFMRVGSYQHLMKAAKGVKSCQKDNHDNDVFAKTRALLILEDEEEHEVDRRHQEACSRALAESCSHFEAFGGKKCHRV